MKLTLNLSLSQSFRQRHVWALALPLLFVSFALLIRMVFSIQSDLRQYRASRQAADREESQRNELVVREAALRQKLDQPQNRKLLRSVEFVNEMIERRQLSVAELTAQLTALMPPEVRLTTLSVPDLTSDPLLHLGIEGSSEAPVETFLSRLEDAPDFTEVTVTSQGFEEKGNGAPVSINCTVRYVGGHARDESNHRPATLPVAARGRVK